MGSLQNIQTKVTYTKGVSFKLLLLTKNKEIKINSGEIITGPFVAKIDPNAECEFETYPIGELKEGYIDEGCVSFLHPGRYAKTALYASAKYGVYEDKLYDSPNQSISNFNEKGYVLARTPNLMYIQTRSGWSAEVVNPQYDGDNRIGSQYNRYAFYFSNADSQRIYVMFRKLSNKDDFEINFRSAIINTIWDSRVIMFNEFPYKFSINKYINKEYKQIKTGQKQFIQFFHALSYYFIGSDFEIKYIFANGSDTTRNPSHYIRITDFCYNVSDYYYMGGDRYSCIQNYYSMPYGAIAFVGGLRNDQFDSGVLPDEPKIYYDFNVNTTYGIHILDENNNNPGDDSSDETIDEDQSNEYFPVEDTVELDGNGIHQSYDMSKIDKLILFVHDIYVIVIHSMEGLIVKAYSSHFNNDLFGTINESSDKKIIYFTGSQGRIEIIRNNAKILSRSDELFVYSGFSLANINSFHDDMLILTNPNSNYTIKNSALDDSNDYNYSLSNDKKYAMWFTSPIELKVTCEYNLPHKQYVYIDGERDFEDDIKTEFIGNNIFFYLAPQSNKDENGIAKYHISPVNDEDISKISNYYQVNTILNTKSDQGIFGPGVDDNNDPKKPEEPKKSPGSKIGITIAIVAAILIVIVIVIIIVVIVVCVRRHKKKNNSSEENSGHCDTQNKFKTAEI